MGPVVNANPSPTGESITLADIKTGDRVAGPGELKSGRFVAKELTVLTPGNGGRRSTDMKEGAEPVTPDSGKPQPVGESPK